MIHLIVNLFCSTIYFILLFFLIFVQFVTQSQEWDRNPFQLGRVSVETVTSEHCFFSENRISKGTFWKHTYRRIIQQHKDTHRTKKKNFIHSLVFMNELSFGFKTCYIEMWGTKSCSFFPCFFSIVFDHWAQTYDNNTRKKILKKRELMTRFSI